MLTGVVTTYFPERKYGFITPDDGSKARFFHITQYQHGAPKLGEHVEFELGEPNTLGKDKQAVRVKPIAPATESAVKAGA
jgi:cold shock CspA family protein